MLIATAASVKSFISGTTVYSRRVTLMSRPILRSSNPHLRGDSTIGVWSGGRQAKWRNPHVRLQSRKSIETHFNASQGRS